ncbi:hypothetical protein K438DRAFT_1814674 [Mycena galopus ATCC 62051]|nr:hypothetical protein K438DRAFT_1814674 [Mycena galopus ATCC 62051]
MPGVELMFGPMLIGAMLNVMLYGVMAVQMLAYYQRYANDSPWIRYFMLYLLLVATADLAIEFAIIYESLIIQNGPMAPVISPKLLPADSVLISFVSAPIQLFSAWRISVITESLTLPGLVALLSLGSFGSGITASVMVFLNPLFSSFGRFTTEVIVWLVLSAVCDIVIAAGITYALYSRKMHSNEIFDGQVNRIIRLTVETGSITALAALADVLIVLVFPRTTINFAVDFPLSTLYICSTLAMLNSRSRPKTLDTEHAHIGLQIQHDPTSLKLKPSLYRNGSKRSQTKLEIYTSTEQLVAVDPASEITLTSHP